MPSFEHQGASTYYEVHGTGFPVLLLAPGGMRSNLTFWQRAPFDPIAELAKQFCVIAMDQRNAGRSSAPIAASDGWPSYTADQLALLDHLGVARFHTLGGCIGGAMALALIDAAPQRVASAVLQQPIGLSPENRSVFYQLFDDWQKEIAPRHPQVEPATWQRFREAMYGGDFVFSVSREAVSRANTPLLVLMGNDIYHPSVTSREIVALASNARLIEHWKDPQLTAATVQSVRSFLVDNTPAS